MNVTVKRSQPRPVIDTVTITFTHDEARVLKLIANNRESVGGILAGVLIVGSGTPTSVHIRNVLNVLAGALGAEDINWSTR